MLVSRNVFLGSRRTSMRLEPEMWEALVEIAAAEGTSLHGLVTRIATQRGANLTSAVRCFVITHYMRQTAQ